MKKFIYSNYTKFIVVVLFIASITLGTLTAINGISDYFDEKEAVYNFESSFPESRFFSPLLDEPENVIYNAYFNLYHPDTKSETPFTVSDDTIAKNIEQRLSNLWCDDSINYYIKWKDRVFTNCGASSPEELMQGEFFSYAFRNGEDGVVRERSTKLKYGNYLLNEIDRYDKTSTIILCANVKQNVVNKYKAIWEQQAEIVNDTFKKVLSFAIAALLLFIYLVCVCGMNTDGEQKRIWIDNIWTELHFIAMLGFGLCTVAVCIMIVDKYVSGLFPENLVNMTVGTTSALASAIILTSLLSIVRNIKCKKFVDSSIVLRVIRWCFRTLVCIFRYIRDNFKNWIGFIFKTMSKKTGAFLISMLFVYTALIGGFGTGVMDSAIWLVLGVILFGAASFFVSYRIKELDEIKKGVSEIKGGNVTYKIPKLKSEDMKILADNINDIAKGLDESVSAKVKAERMKTELITNVSHDLKTPITSIINYTELLSKIEELPEEAKDYVSVISKKGERLKNLTQDLFDISKAQSGNEEVIFERLDVSLLINQALGEHDSEIQKSELTFCVDTPKELYISADGRKMSRVVSNLINNILKYSLKNTRVFITALENDNNITIELKNISSYPMNFSADEIVGRFVRGDESRTAEGNGLGLAIAKSYTELCGGKFEVLIDGDMFKAILNFKKYE